MYLFQRKRPATLIVDVFSVFQAHDSRMLRKQRKSLERSRGEKGPYVDGRVNLMAAAVSALHRIF